MSQAKIKKLRELGYAVEPALFEDSEEKTVYRVTGEGIDTQVTEGDRKAWAALVDQHDERVKQAKENDPEKITKRRRKEHPEEFDGAAT